MPQWFVSVMCERPPCLPPAAQVGGASLGRMLAKAFVSARAVELGRHSVQQVGCSRVAAHRSDVLQGQSCVHMFNCVSSTQRSVCHSSDQP